MTELQKFIATYIGSVEQLEILLLLKKDPDRAWSAAEISMGFRSSLDSISARLQGLLNNGLATRIENGNEQVFKYHAPSEAIDQQIASLQVVYAQKRSAVINMIYTGVSRQGGSSAVRDLADAFKFDRGGS